MRTIDPLTPRNADRYSGLIETVDRVVNTTVGLCLIAFGTLVVAKAGDPLSIVIAVVLVSLGLYLVRLPR